MLVSIRDRFRKEWQTITLVDVTLATERMHERHRRSSRISKSRLARKDKKIYNNLIGDSSLLLYKRYCIVGRGESFWRSMGGQEVS